MVAPKMGAINKEKEEKELINRIKFFLKISGNLTVRELKKIYLKNRKKYPLKFKKIKKIKEYQINNKNKN